MKPLDTFRNNTAKKIRSRVGETIAETLVALLIAALALTMLAGAISASTSIVTKSRNTLNAYYDKNETTVVGMKDKYGTIDLDLNAGNLTNSDYEDITVDVYRNDTFGNDALVIAYKKTTD